MATPKMSLEEACMGMTGIITIGANGDVTSSAHVFILDTGSIQFNSECQYALTATFTPLGIFGDPDTGEVAIPAGQNTIVPSISDDDSNVCVNYGITGTVNGTDVSFGPYSVTLGCAPLTLYFDENGDMTVEDNCIPNGGAIDLEYDSAATQNITISFSDSQGKNPFGTTPITLSPGQSQLIHATKTDTTVTISTSNSISDGTGGTVKIGSGGTGPE
jgi:hypothetical protein